MKRQQQEYELEKAFFEKVYRTCTPPCQGISNTWSLECMMIYFPEKEFKLKVVRYQNQGNLIGFLNM